MNINLSLKTKIISLSIGATVLTSLAVILLFILKLSALETKIHKQTEKNDKEKFTQIVSNIYKSCQITDDLINQELNTALDMAEKNIHDKGGVSVINKSNKVEIINQYTKDKIVTDISEFAIGGLRFNLNKDFDNYTPIVDDSKVFKNIKLTIFQKINSKGDMLRIATNVSTKENKRAVGTFIPAINPDGNENPVIKAVIGGSSFSGNAYVVNYWYQTIYRPIKNNKGEVIGMLFAGMSLSNVKALREMILKTKVGETGYVYVISGSGEKKGTYIISKKGERDGENIWNTKDNDGKPVIQTIVNQATSSPENDVTYLTYNWLNKGESAPVEKIVALTYFKPFDWVIGAGASTKEIFALANETKSSFTTIYLFGILVSLIVITIMVIISIVISKRIAYPIQKSAEIMTTIANGNVETALIEIDRLKKYYFKK